MPVKVESPPPQGLTDRGPDLSGHYLVPVAPSAPQHPSAASGRGQRPMAPFVPRPPSTASGRGRRPMVTQQNPALTNTNMVDKLQGKVEDCTSLTMPDFVLDARNWFIHFDTLGRGMNMQELMAALSHTYRCSTSSEILVKGVRKSWPGSSSLITPNEFICRGGIRDHLLAHLGHPPVAIKSETLETHTAGGMQQFMLPFSSRLAPLNRPMSAHVFGSGNKAVTKRPMSAHVFGSVNKAFSKRPMSANPFHAARSAALQQFAKLDVAMPWQKTNSELVPKALDVGTRNRPNDTYSKQASNVMNVRQQTPSGLHMDTFNQNESRLDSLQFASEYSFGGRAPLRRALLIGINYIGSKAALKGCIHDVKNMYRLLLETFHWKPMDIRILTDDGSNEMPTRKNIIDALRWLGEAVAPGDVLFFHFSGHGAQQKDPSGYEEHGMNETILPVDFAKEGMISDDLVGDILIRSLPENSRLIVVMDSCHTGTGLDLPFRWHNRSWLEATNPYFVSADVQLFTACFACGEAETIPIPDVPPAYDAQGGPMTTAFCDVLRNSHSPSYSEFMQHLNQLLRRNDQFQKAQLTSSQTFDADRPFLLSDIIPNKHSRLGRTFRRKFSPRPRRMHGPLKDILLIQKPQNSLDFFWNLKQGASVMTIDPKLEGSPLRSES